MTHPLAARRIAMILAALEAGPLTVHALSVKVSLHYDRTREYVFDLAAQHLVHIKAWKPLPTGRQHPVAVYVLGAGKDAKKPKRMTGAQRQAAMRKRIFADQERRELYLARGRAMKRVKRAISKPQTWISALGAV